MKKHQSPSSDNAELSQDDIDLFRQSIGTTKRVKSDTVRLTSGQKKHIGERQQVQRQSKTEFYFSDEYIPDIDTQGTVSYVKEGEDRYLAKQLRRGDYAPELILDCHGMNKETVKLELAALISACKKQHVSCACVVHGIGERILKHKVPQYLVQHPDIIAMHQAPLEYGGKGALLILIDLPVDVSPLL
ncbi:endonuclease SmrB [Pseudoalteromonas sp. YIC-827]|uniref:Ribosome rescue factor SmrB n=1 Tax=Pseudoalteromonas qingdaonensis TaxID=3131913 RepID=A0ABU9N045_9GAMM